MPRLNEQSPILYQLEEAGVIVGEPEDIDSSEAGRPPRVYYRPGGTELSDEFLVRLRIPDDCALEPDS